MYNAHIPKAWRPYTDFHTYSLADVYTEKKLSLFSFWDGSVLDTNQPAKKR